MARGYGRIHPTEDNIWTLLTTMVELKRHDEPAGLKRPLGIRRGASKHREAWAVERACETAESGCTTQLIA